MPCSYLTTTPSSGDNLVVLLNKWLQAVGGSFGCGAQSEWFSLAQLVTLYGGTPRPGDYVPTLWLKLRRLIAGEQCFCGDSAWDSARRILDVLGPGSFSPGDSIYNIVWAILEAVNGGAVPVPPVPVPPVVDSCCLLLESNGFDLELETNTNCLALESCPG